MPGPIVVRDGVVVPEHELQWRFSRSSGPGGQSVNTTDSRVELSVDVAASAAFTQTQRQRALDRLRNRLVDGVLTVAASEYRSQLRNRQAAERRMAQILREAIAPPPPRRRPTKPTQASVRRRLDSKRQRGELKQQRRAPDA
ncbi:MAG TPA: alternative ribosome rescue aminoacyl-tRNA hydrolase ArfB [Nocardioidaceae bacterium]|jgi:ribosome-associated protein